MTNGIPSACEVIIWLVVVLTKEVLSSLWILGLIEVFAWACIGCADTVARSIYTPICDYTGVRPGRRRHGYLYIGHRLPVSGSHDSWHDVRGGTIILSLSCHTSDMRSRFLYS